MVEAAKTHGIELKQTFAKEGRQANFKAARCPCAPVQTHAQAINASAIVGRLQRE
ncbi:MAG: hypothetical protein U1E84_16500 [Rhodoferax sp.]